MLVLFRHEALPRARSMGQAALMFGCFLGTFGGVTCASENIFGQRSIMSVFIGGSAAGTVLAARRGSPRTVIITGFGTGLLTSMLHWFVTP